MSDKVKGSCQCKAVQYDGNRMVCLGSFDDPTFASPTVLQDKVASSLMV